MPTDYRVQICACTQKKKFGKYSLSKKHFLQKLKKISLLLALLWTLVQIYFKSNINNAQKNIFFHKNCVYKESNPFIDQLPKESFITSLLSNYATTCINNKNSGSGQLDLIIIMLEA